MAHGRKTGGRRPGTPNKLTAAIQKDLRDRLAKKGVDVDDVIVDALAMKDPKWLYAVASLFPYLQGKVATVLPPDITEMPEEELKRLAGEETTPTETTIHS